MFGGEFFEFFDIGGGGWCVGCEGDVGVLYELVDLFVIGGLKCSGSVGDCGGGGCGFG